MPIATLYVLGASVLFLGGWLALAAKLGRPRLDLLLRGALYLGLPILLLVGLDRWLPLATVFIILLLIP